MAILFCHSLGPIGLEPCLMHEIETETGERWGWHMAGQTATVVNLDRAFVAAGSRQNGRGVCLEEHSLAQ